MSIIEKAGRLPSVAAAKSALKGGTARDLAIPGYDKRTAEDIAPRLKGLTQHELRAVRTYEKAHQNRPAIAARIARLTAAEPWSAYDDQPVEAIARALRTADGDTVRQVRDFEREHKARPEVLAATERYIGNVS